jgi:hypothetical protein
VKKESCLHPVDSDNWKYEIVMEETLLTRRKVTKLSRVVLQCKVGEYTAIGER